VEAAAVNFVNHTVLWMIPVVVPLVCWFLWWSWRRRQALVRLFVSERLLPRLLEGVSPARQKIKLALQAGAVLFLLLALARPQWGFVWEEANQRGRDILVAIDTSRSMLAEDMAPNRLTRAKLAALDLLRLAKNDRLGLIAFAGGAFLQSPLTLDDEAFRQNVNELDTSIIPQGGTSLSEAIDTALTAFAAEEGENHHVLVIFTDGEDQDTGALETAEKAAEKNLRIFTVGVGTPAGELLKITDENGKSSYIKDESGNVVKSRLNEDLLRQIATKANGFYLALREGNAMQALYQRGLEPLPTSEISSKLVRHLNEQFHWPLGIAIALLLAEMLLPPAPKKRGKARTSAGAGKTAEMAVALIFLLFAIPANGSPAKAFRSYQNGDYKDARNEYERLLEKKPDDPKLRYNAGAAAYKAGAYDAAVKDFAAAANAPDLNLQEMAYYNLGNSNYKLGSDEGDPQKKMALWQQAVQNFESSLKLNPKDTDAAFNRDLVKKKLEELKKQQQQEQKQDQKDQNKDNKDENKDKQKQDQKDQQQKQDNKDQEQKDQSDKQDQQKKDNKDSKSREQKEQEEKQRQEQKEQEKQQQQQAKDQKDQAGKDKKDAQKQGGNEKTDQEQKDAKAEAEQEARAMALGQMTQKQAQQMLDAQKSSEKALIYRQTMESKKGRERSLKDW
jgi:Ca-activated chloride channel family protein